MAIEKKIDKKTVPSKAARSADEICAELAARGIDERDVAAAVLWARKKEKPASER
jgi:hypothetical protein